MTFVSFDSLKHHKYIHVSSVHEGNKPFKYDTCNYRTPCKGDLKKVTFKMHDASVHERNKLSIGDQKELAIHWRPERENHNSFYNWFLTGPK